MRAYVMVTLEGDAIDVALARVHVARALHDACRLSEGCSVDVALVDTPDEGEPCPYEWWAPRADVPDSVPVRHVCKLGRTDHVLHVCPCGRNAIA